MSEKAIKSVAMDLLCAADELTNLSPI